MSFNDHKDLAIVSVAVAPSPADSGTTLKVLLTDPGLSYMPTPPFYATAAPANTRATPANSEIVKVTAQADDATYRTYTMTRLQGTPATSARSIIVGDDFFAGPVAVDIQMIEDASVYDMGKRAVMNGNFNIWQRGTSLTNPTNGKFLADRWKIVYAVASPPTNIIHTRQALTPGDIDGSFYFYRINPDGAGTVGAAEYYELEQRIEHAVRFLCGAGKKITVSFKARSSIGSKKLGVWLQQNYGTGGTPSSADTLNGSYVTLTSSWADYSITFDAATLVGKTFGTNNDDYLRLVLMAAWGSDYTSIVGSTSDFGGSGNIDIAQVKINQGNYALPFKPVSPGIELARCQRYCFVIQDPSNANTNIAIGFASSTTVVYAPVVFPVEMRTAPSLTATADHWQLADQSTAAKDLTALSIASSQNGKSQTVLQATVASGLTQFRPYLLYADSAARQMIFEAEL